MGRRLPGGSRNTQQQKVYEMMEKFWCVFCPGGSTHPEASYTPRRYSTFEAAHARAVEGTQADPGKVHYVLETVCTVVGVHDTVEMNSLSER